MANDQDYRDNKKKSQKKWRNKNKDYWRNYRKKNTEYTYKNRIQQRYRNKKRVSDIAKSDELKELGKPIPGYYRLVPLCKKIAKSDELIVRLMPAYENPANAFT
ncbi:MAG: hypothetical protein HQM08_30405 [Candidatus Riflebacteria bacterium]|nr:hypothetical protein [Candidatus Riflebacteria bacterium]